MSHSAPAPSSLAKDSPSTPPPATTTTTTTTTPQLALPAPPADASGPIKLDVGTGESVSLYDRLGPAVVNSDGTLSRIVGWSEMGPDERARILRVLGKRNQIRLDAKKEQLSNAATAEPQ
ncbi:hypothetical protein JCM11491_003571 [Sporobolomyces phaffii]